MFSFLKKLLSPGPGLLKPEDPPVFHYSLHDKLMEMAAYPDLAQLFYSPVNKLYILNVYASTYGELMDHLISQEVNRPISAVSVFAFFNQAKVDLAYQFTRIATFSQTNKINQSAEHDLLEIYQTFLYFLDMESHHGK